VNAGEVDCASDADDTAATGSSGGPYQPGDPRAAVVAATHVRRPSAFTVALSPLACRFLPVAFVPAVFEDEVVRYRARALLRATPLQRGMSDLPSLSARGTRWPLRTTAMLLPAPSPAFGL
jgi:hypothetical protein